MDARSLMNEKISCKGGAIRYLPKTRKPAEVKQEAVGKGVKKSKRIARVGLKSGRWTRCQWGVLDAK